MQPWMFPWQASKLARNFLSRSWYKSGIFKWLSNCVFSDSRRFITSPFPGSFFITVLGIRWRYERFFISPLPSQLRSVWNAIHSSVSLTLTLQKVGAPSCLDLPICLAVHMNWRQWEHTNTIYSNRSSLLNSDQYPLLVELAAPAILP